MLKFLDKGAFLIYFLKENTEKANVMILSGVGLNPAGKKGNIASRNDFE